MLVKPTIPMTPQENVGFTSISNKFHEFGKTSGAQAIVSGIMEIVGNVGKTNNFHDSPQTIYGKCWFYRHFQHVPWILRNFGSKQIANTKLGSLRSHSKRNLAFPETKEHKQIFGKRRFIKSGLTWTGHNLGGGVQYLYIYICMYACMHVCMYVYVCMYVCMCVCASPCYFNLTCCTNLCVQLFL